MRPGADVPRQNIKRRTLMRTLLKTLCVTLALALAALALPAGAFALGQAQKGV